MQYQWLSESEEDLNVTPLKEVNLKTLLRAQICLFDVNNDI